ncbi:MULTISPECIES: hypothetical protein [unclassified Frankia]|uniref:hypothetical protein n=1 Tax=unclassified Frankia TaxID=2632575 RepID=UPI000A9E789B|nr:MULTISPECIES: hypothetical protein [unclassified Frankia]
MMRAWAPPTPSLPPVVPKTRADTPVRVRAWVRVHLPAPTVGRRGGALVAW